MSNVIILGRAPYVIFLGGVQKYSLGPCEFTFSLASWSASESLPGTLLQQHYFLGGKLDIRIFYKQHARVDLGLPPQFKEVRGKLCHYHSVCALGKLKTVKWAWLGWFLNGWMMGPLLHFYKENLSAVNKHSSWKCFIAYSL